jgi:signal peptidase II
MVTTIIISIILLCIDQISKLLVVNLLTKTDSITIIKNFFYLTYINNDGAAFSILVGKRIFLILIAVLVIVMLIRYIKKNNIQNKLELVSISLIIGGSLGNLMDRVIRGYVIDFLDFKIFNYNFPIFNLADTFIVIGVILLLLKEIRKENNLDSRNK